MGLTFAELADTQLGAISFMAGEKGLQRVAFSSLEMFKEKLGITEVDPSFKGLETVGRLMAEINAYFFGILKTFTIEVDWDQLQGFQRQVLELTFKIPYGQVMTYGEIAKRLGKPGGARAVGRALGDNPMPIVLPCHRVIGSEGNLRGYTAGISKKAFLLGLEGHIIEGDQLKKK